MNWHWYLVQSDCRKENCDAIFDRSCFNTTDLFRGLFFFKYPPARGHKTPANFTNAFNIAFIN